MQKRIILNPGQVPGSELKRLNPKVNNRKMENTQKQIREKEEKVKRKTSKVKWTVKLSTENPKNKNRPQGPGFQCILNDLKNELSW